MNDCCYRQRFFVDFSLLKAKRVKASIDCAIVVVVVVLTLCHCHELVRGNRTDSNRSGADASRMNTPGRAIRYRRKRVYDCTIVVVDLALSYLVVRS